MTTDRTTGNRSGLLIAAWPILICLLPLISPTQQHFSWMAMGLVWGLWIVSLNIVWGYTGALSVAQMALGAVTVYTFVILRFEHEMHFIPALAIGLVLAALASLVLSLAALRLQGFYFAILTVAFASVVTTVITNWDTAGRSSGLLVSRRTLPTLEIFGLRWNLGSGEGGFYLLVAVVFLAVNALAVYIARSHAGRAMFAVRDDELLATSVGMNPTHLKTIAFLLSAVVAGVAGLMQAFAFQLVVPELYSFNVALLSLLLLVVGGLGSTSGPAIGALIYTILYQAAPIEGEWRSLMLGLAVIVAIFLFPGGIAGVLARTARRTFGRSPATEPPPDDSATNWLSEPAAVTHASTGPQEVKQP